MLVNASAIWGQAGWAFDNITTAPTPDLARWGIAVMFAAAIESIGIYLAWESHEALMADQASFGLRLGSYGVGVLAGILNFLHFSHQSVPTGIAFGVLSAISPRLWGVWSTARNRSRLAALGLVDVRAVRLSTARKLWHPIRSVKVMYHATWAGIVDPAAAVTAWEIAQSVELPTTGTRADPATSDGLTPFERGLTARDRVRQLAAQHPEWTQVQLATAAGCSDRTVRNALATAKGA